MFGDFMFGSEVREQNICSSFFIFQISTDGFFHAWRRLLTKTARLRGCQACYGSVHKGGAQNVTFLLYKRCSFKNYDLHNHAILYDYTLCLQEAFEEHRHIVLWCI